MNRNVHTQPLPKREQQVLELVYRLGKATVHDVQAQLPDQPSYSATRMLLQRLHKKEHLRAERDGARYLYSPKHPKGLAGRAAFKNLLNTFFNDSPAEALHALIADEAVDEAELANLEALIAQTQQKKEKNSKTKGDE